MRSLASVLESVFENLDRRVEERWSAGNLSHGFWRTGAIPKLTPVDTLREYGFWQGKGDLEKGLFGQVSVALIGGHTRIGVFLPNVLLEGMPIAGCNSTWGESLTDAIAKAHDGQPAHIVRRVGGDTLFDRIFTEAPFSAEWLLRCTQDTGAQSILENHLAWRVIDLWESALRTVLSRQINDPDIARQSKDPDIVVHSVKPLPASITETLPITLQASYEVQTGHWVTIVATAPESEWELTDVEAQLRNLLPDYGIVIQKKDTVA